MNDAKHYDDDVADGAMMNDANMHDGASDVGDKYSYDYSDCSAYEKLYDINCTQHCLVVVNVVALYVFSALIWCLVVCRIHHIDGMQSKGGGVQDVRPGGWAILHLDCWRDDGYDDGYCCCYYHL